MSAFMILYVFHLNMDASRTDQVFVAGRYMFREDARTILTEHGRVILTEDARAEFQHGPK